MTIKELPPLLLEFVIFCKSKSMYCTIGMDWHNCAIGHFYNYYYHTSSGLTSFSAEGLGFIEKVGGQLTMEDFGEDFSSGLKMTISDKLNYNFNPTTYEDFVPWLLVEVKEQYGLDL